MGRPRQFDELAALDAATEIFWSQGFEATSLKDLLDGMALSKSSLYETFTNKEALFRRCLDHYADRLVAALDADLSRAKSGLCFVEGVLRGVGGQTRAGAERRGCLVMNSAAEFGQREPDIAQLITRHTKRFEAIFARALEQAKQERLVSPTMDGAATSKFLVCTLSGLKTMVKAGAKRRAVEDMVDVAMGVFSPR